MLVYAHTDLGDIFTNFFFLNYFVKLYHTTWLYQNYSREHMTLAKAGVHIHLSMGGFIYAEFSLP